MLSKTDLAKLYDTVLSIPGMSDTVKIDLKLPRKNVLLLSKVIQRGLAQNGEGEESAIVDLSSPQTIEELTAVASELLHKAGLTDMNEKLKSF